MYKGRYAVDGVFFYEVYIIKRKVLLYRIEKIKSKSPKMRKCPLF